MLYILLAEGFEETEAIAPIDVIRRANIPITPVGVTGKCVKGAHDITLCTDIGINDVSKDDIEGVILPGGMPGTTNLQKDDRVISLLEYCRDNNKLIGAICAAPSILGHKGILNGKRAVCYDGFETQLFGAEIGNTPVCRDGNIITAVGAGAALEFGFKLTEAFSDSKQANRIKESMKCIQ